MTYCQELKIFYSQVIIAHFADWVESFITLSDSQLLSTYFWVLSSRFIRVLYCILICQFSNYHKIMSCFIKWWLLLLPSAMVMYAQNQEYKWISSAVQFLSSLGRSLFMETTSIHYGMNLWLLWWNHHKIHLPNYSA